MTPMVGIHFKFCQVKDHKADPPWTSTANICPTHMQKCHCWPFLSIGVDSFGPPPSQTDVLWLMGLPHYPLYTDAAMTLEVGQTVGGMGDGGPMYSVETGFTHSTPTPPDTVMGNAPGTPPATVTATNQEDPEPCHWCGRGHWDPHTTKLYVEGNDPRPEVSMWACFQCREYLTNTKQWTAAQYTALSESYYIKPRFALWGALRREDVDEDELPKEVGDLRMSQPACILKDIPFNLYLGDLGDVADFASPSVMPAALNQAN